jgi:hypothetical protein
MSAAPWLGTAGARARRAADVAVNGGDAEGFGNANYPGGVAFALVYGVGGSHYVVRWTFGDDEPTAERYRSANVAAARFFELEEEWSDRDPAPGEVAPLTVVAQVDLTTGEITRYLVTDRAVIEVLEAVRLGESYPEVLERVAAAYRTGDRPLTATALRHLVNAWSTISGAEVPT